VKAAASLTISCGEAIREVLKGLKKLLKKKRVDGKQNTLCDGKVRIYIRSRERRR
jgi:hypothetical protein